MGDNELCADYDWKHADLLLDYCTSAAKILKGRDNQTMEFRVTDTSEEPPEHKSPQFCYVSDNIVWYNKDPNGKRRKGCKPVCERKFAHSQP